MADANSTSSTTDDSTTLPKQDAMIDDEFADKLLADMVSREAILTPEEMDLIEQVWESDRSTRRSALIMLTKPFSWLKQTVESDDDFANAATDVFLCLNPDKYEVVANLLGEARSRLMCALACREDMKDLLDKAKAVKEVNHV